MHSQKHCQAIGFIAILYNNQIKARALIGQAVGQAVGYCAGKPTEKSRVF